MNWKPCLAISILLIFITICSLQPGAEDAVILYRYADNLAQYHQIAYNPLGSHTEGATDFLWMLLIALGRLMHLPDPVTVGLLNAVSLLGLSVLFSRALDMRFSWDALLFTAAALFLTPQCIAGICGFSVLAFALLLLWFLDCYLRGESRQMAVVALLLCLLRPDGVVFALPIYVFAMLKYGRDLRWWRDLLSMFLLPGLVYFCWRVWYFGELMPLPFIVKANALRWHHLFVLESVQDISRYFLPALFVIGLIASRVRDTLPIRQITVGAILVPALFYSRMRLDQNFADRFFLFLVAVPAYLACKYHNQLRCPRYFYAVVFGFIWLLAYSWAYCFSVIHLFTDQRQTDRLVAKEMARRGLHGTMAITEAGHLAYDTQWNAMDLWGLNTPRFAHKLVGANDIQRLHADLIVVRYTQCTFEEKPMTTTTRTWGAMANNALYGAEVAGQYIEVTLPYSESSLGSRAERLAGGDETYLCYFVNRKYSDKQALLDILHSLNGNKS